VTEIWHTAFTDNPLTSITIGANVGFAFPGEPSDVFGNGFDSFYNSGGQQAGMYTLNNGAWSLAGGASPFTFRNDAITGENGGTISEYNGTDKSVVIPSQIQGQAVIEIGYNTFQGKQLTDVTIPNGIVMIWDNAFDGNLLTSVTFPDSVKYINRDAFKNNPLTSITIGADVELGLTPGLGVTGFGISQAFDNYYNDGGKQAGTYILNNDAWSLKGLNFYVGYAHDTDMNQLAGRSKVTYGSGGETVIIYSNIDLYEFKIFNNGADYLSGDVNVARNVLSASTYVEYMTTIPEGMPAEAVHFKTADGKEHYYLLEYSGMDGTVVASRVEG